MFLHSIEYFNGFLYDLAQKSSFCLQGTRNARKRTKKIQTIVFKVSSFVGNPAHDSGNHTETTVQNLLRLCSCIYGFFLCRLLYLKSWRSSLESHPVWVTLYVYTIMLSSFNIPSIPVPPGVPQNLYLIDNLKDIIVFRWAVDTRVFSMFCSKNSTINIHKDLRTTFEIVNLLERNHENLMQASDKAGYCCKSVMPLLKVRLRALKWNNQFLHSKICISWSFSIRLRF